MVDVDRQLLESELERVAGGVHQAIERVERRFNASLDRIETKVDRVNGGVRDAHIQIGEQRGRIDQLHQRIEGIATKVHDVVNRAYTEAAKSVHQLVASAGVADADGVVRRTALHREVRIAIACLGAGAAAVMWILRLMGKI